MVAITNAPRLRMDQDGFVDRGRRRRGLSFLVVFGFVACGLFTIFRSRHALGVMNGKAQELGAKRLLDMLGVCRIELVLFRKPPMRPFGGRIFTADRVPTTIARRRSAFR
jgi:hypothetical protein